MPRGEDKRLDGLFLSSFALSVFGIIFVGEVFGSFSNLVYVETLSIGVNILGVTESIQHILSVCMTISYGYLTDIYVSAARGPRLPFILFSAIVASVSSLVHAHPLHFFPTALVNENDINEDEDICGEARGNCSEMRTCLADMIRQNRLPDWRGTWGGEIRHQTRQPASTSLVWFYITSFVFLRVLVQAHCRGLISLLCD